MQTVALIAAMHMETRPLLRRVGAHGRERIGRFTCFRFELPRSRCVLMETGVGISRATDGARALLEAEQPALVVSFGIAGAPRAGLSIGDVIAARSVARLQGGRQGRSRQLGQLTETVREAVRRAVETMGSRLEHGVVLTTRGEQALAPDELAAENPVLDMETAGVAEVCARAGVPLLCLRAISDSVEAPLPFDLSDYLDDAQQLRIGRLIGAVLRRPGLLPSLLRVGRNAQKAADNAAAAVLAAVNALKPGSPP